jgi:hypothetical protein
MTLISSHDSSPSALRSISGVLMSRVGDLADGMNKATILYSHIIQLKKSTMAKKVAGLVNKLALLPSNMSELREASLAPSML